ncbi:SMI1/KNR4 family protein [Streptomyces sp. TRM66268-LWL]|uniref:SMI1/KNR4 family protein n=2 Tax=Streptomyces polyasparticus TaxID=2767826 RepID=A0ABR7SDP6_9ACTN|nr:SMI1/KNR4 family protein [Streptomyces polyasparticus]
MPDGDALAAEAAETAVTGVTFGELRALLGEPAFRGADPQAWSALEQRHGVEFPADYKEFADAYGAVLINNQLTLFHPATAWHNLGENIREEQEFYEDWPEDMMPPYPIGTGPGEMFPWAHSATGEMVYFRVPRDGARDWAVGVIEHDEFGYVEYPVTFNEWMRAYLRGAESVGGEEMLTHSRNFAPDGPFFTMLAQPRS